MPTDDSTMRYAGVNEVAQSKRLRGCVDIAGPALVPARGMVLARALIRLAQASESNSEDVILGRRCRQLLEESTWRKLLLRRNDDHVASAKLRVCQLGPVYTQRSHVHQMAPCSRNRAISDES
jgi:hypothetical protein